MGYFKQNPRWNPVYKTGPAGLPGASPASCPFGGPWGASWNPVWKPLSGFSLHVLGEHGEKVVIPATSHPLDAHAHIGSHLSLTTVPREVFPAPL